MGLVGPRAQMRTAIYTPIPYGYVTYDVNRMRAVKTILDYYKAHDISSIGRYGAWEYSSMEDAMEYGRKTAELLNRQIDRPNSTPHLSREKNRD